MSGSGVPFGSFLQGAGLRPGFPFTSAAVLLFSSASGRPSLSLSNTGVLKITAAHARQSYGLALVWSTVVTAVSPKPSANVMPLICTWPRAKVGFAQDRSDDGLVEGNGL